MWCRGPRRRATCREWCHWTARLFPHTRARAQRPPTCRVSSQFVSFGDPLVAEEFARTCGPPNIGHEHDRSARARLTSNPTGSVEHDSHVGGEFLGVLLLHFVRI